MLVMALQKKMKTGDWLQNENRTLIIDYKFYQINLAMFFIILDVNKKELKLKVKVTKLRKT